MTRIFYLLGICILCISFPKITLAQPPANDNCVNAIPVNITGGGFDLGTFNSTPAELADASVQSGETFAPAILGAGLSHKSVWYKFTIPTSRKVTVYLFQTGTVITAGDVGFTVYKGNNCLPANAQISTKLTPIGFFGSTSHQCTDSATYLVQVSSKLATSGQIYISVKTELTNAPFDSPAQAYNFGTLSQGTYAKIVDVECQSIENELETCNTLTNYQKYSKSTWHVFKTPNYFDYLSLMLAKASSGGQAIVGMKIYDGDVTTSSYTSLPLLVSCDSVLLFSYNIWRKNFMCGILAPNKTYSIQLFFSYDFVDQVKIILASGGTTPTQAPQPILSAMPSPSNNMGVLASDINGISTSTSDYFGCNSRHSLTACGPSITTPGVFVAPNNYTYNLSTFFTFTLSHTSNINYYVSQTYCGGNNYIRLFNQGATTCGALDTSNIIALSTYSGSLTCLPPGNYTMQVMGREWENPTSWYSYYSYGEGNNLNPPCLFTDLGNKVNLTINVKRVKPDNKYSLSAPGAFDSINVVNGIMTPLPLDTWVSSKLDTFGCANTVLPSDTTCHPNNKKAIYRQFIVADSGILHLNYTGLSSRIYKSDANALAIAQNTFAYPQEIQNMQEQTKCIQNWECGNHRVCVVPGTYTHVSFGSDNQLGQAHQQNYYLSSFQGLYGNPANAENLGDIISLVNPASGGTINSSFDYYTCKDNAVPIDGVIPCMINGDTASKAIYREFYVSTPAQLSIYGTFYNPSCYYQNSGKISVFAGKASNGLSTLTTITSNLLCFDTYTPTYCQTFQPGWYTVVTYGSGPSFENPFKNLYEYGYSSYVASPSKISINISPICPGPKFNRPFKAAIDTLTNAPFLIQWGPKQGHTAAYPKTDTTYTLYTENFNCTVDTPFSSHPIIACNPGVTKTAYWVFKTTQESYIQINTNNFEAALYSGNARNGTTGFDSSTMIQKCIASTGSIQICRLQPGEYTLVVFANNYNQNCTSVTPSIYIDRLGYSRFDHAKNAYDFGLIASDSIWHYGKPGDVNPLDPARAPSNDFFYCNTGAQLTDPTENTCWSKVIPEIYSNTVNQALFNPPNFFGSNWIPRRNLWYTFTLDKGGTTRVRVENKTPGKSRNYRFAVYKTDASGTIPFSSLVSTGNVDSTYSQGQTLVTQNYPYIYYLCFGNSNEISFYRSPCAPATERYYVIIDNPNTLGDSWDWGGMRTSNQLEVSILMDSVTAIQPLFDHYSTAGVIGTNLGSGNYTGPTDNYSCATTSASDPNNYGYNYCSKKTLWYKFTVSVAGKIYYRVRINNGYSAGSSYDQVQLFRQVIPGDSTTNGLLHLPISYYKYDPQGHAYYGTCVSPGTYYLFLPGCNRVDEYVRPELIIEEEKGDFCSAPMVATLNGPGTSITSLTVDCHTIGTDYGEFNNTLTCPNGAARNNYKTSWFRLDVTGTDTLDVTTYLTENTTASSSQIKYRMMDGNCGAMQERSCVQDALTQDTYKCLMPGKSYYFQVFTPTSATGTISLNLSAVIHADTCAAEKNCLSTAAFIPEFDCTLNDSVKFNNISTFGSGVSYQWNFGYNNQTSTSVSPVFVYPILSTSQTYTVTLKVTNGGCNPGTQNVDSVSQTITMPGRPNVNLGKDTMLCTYGNTLLLDATTWPGTTYQWNTGETTPTKNASWTGIYPYSVTATYNGCIKRDTIKIGIMPINKIYQQHYLCGNDSVGFNSYRGHAETYLWNTGSTLSYMYAKTENLYTNQVNWKGCIAIDSFKVIAAKEPFASKDTTICAPFQSFILNVATPPAIAYYWSTGAGTPSITVNGPGTYSVQVHHGACLKKDTIQVFVSPGSLTNASNASICEGSSFVLPWGAVATTTGLYSDTLKYPSGCDSLIRKVNLYVTQVNSIVTNPNICTGQNYVLPWGTIVNNAGNYRDTIRTLAGCDSVIRSVNLSINQLNIAETNETICSNQSYILPWGQVVNSPGLYSDTLDYLAGCDSLIRKINLTVLSTTQVNSTASICSGQSFTLPWGTVVSTSGTYSDTLHYLNGCDSLVQSVTLTVNPPSTQNISASICEGQSFTLPWGQIVSTTGVYNDTIQYISGCDSLVTSVDLIVMPLQTSANSVSICQGNSYILPWGETVNTSGIYKDTVQYLNGCDSLIRTINLSVLNTTLNSSVATVCSGQSFTTSWGQVINSAGTYSDTSHYANSCDSVITTLILNVDLPATQTLAASICQGQNYTLPWGQVVNITGSYSDTTQYISGCDSLVTTVNLTVKPLYQSSSDASICQGAVYILPWGQTVNATGIYTDTIQYLSGCDSLVNTVNLTVMPLNTTQNTINVCSGQSYTLPWGQVVNSAGIYKDTLHYVNGCDSLIRTVEINVDQPLSLNLSASICEGSGYVLPWGTSVSASGVYSDTVQYASGCDSLVTTVTLEVKPLFTANTSAVICQGSSYQLPSGITVSTAGTYVDTVSYLSGCDSLVRTVILSVQSPENVIQSATICSGQSFTLPWGGVVNSTGVYKDTVSYAFTGCDSLIQTINLTVQQTASQTSNAVICQGQDYILPWGETVSSTGTYKDTLHYISGCDSLVNIVNLQVQTATTTNNSVTLCQGQSYTLPWGQVVNSSGIYSDTLHYLSGCDSIISNVDVFVRTLSVNNSSATICAGSSYTLPWGNVVSTAGIYSDTLNYADGCDSVINTIAITVQQPLNLNTSAIICAGTSYTLPWGTIVSAPGIYRDTVTYASGCDSLVTQVNLSVQNQTTTSSNVTLCQGQSHILPWGITVNSSGIYRDTLSYINTGCDSLIREVIVDVKPLTVQSTNATTCSGIAYVLPWGTSVTTSGTYSDTLSYINGCDSLVRTVHLNVTAAAGFSSNSSICSGESFTLPWGAVVTSSGLYRDTVKTAFGCDSLIRSVQLTVNASPVVNLQKSNDINCVLGTSTLSASGGVQYIWSPAGSLNNAAVRNPVASPTSTTMYHVKVISANDCITEDSILVNVDLGSAADGYYVASAFTPDGDGKNDCFGVRTWGAVTDLKFSIFNRWGEIVFSTTDPMKCWNGTYKNTQQRSEVFVYVISAKTICGPVVRKGTVTLIR